MRTVLGQLSTLLAIASMFAVAIGLPVLLTGFWPIALILIVGGILGLFVAAAFSLGGYRTTNPAWACPKCGYDMRGLNARSGCPECGHNTVAELLAYRLPFWHRGLPAWVCYPPLLSLAAIAAYLGLTGDRFEFWHALVPIGVLLAAVLAAKLLDRSSDK